MIEISFSKMHGLHNSFIIMNDLSNYLSTNFNLNSLSKELCSKHSGLGADGLVLLSLASSKDKFDADLKMNIFNADGSEAMMCGNAIRCLAKHAYDEDILKKKKITFETLGGLIHTTLLENEVDKARVKVNLGIPHLENTEELGLNLGDWEKGSELGVQLISIGNRHLVLFVDDFNFDYHKKANEIQKAYSAINVEFVKLMGNNKVEMRVIEAGVGETLACGTGACASAVASIQKKLVPGKMVLVKLKGGELEILWQNSNEVFMTGEAKLVAKGTYFLEETNHLKPHLK